MSRVAIVSGLALALLGGAAASLPVYAKKSEPATPRTPEQSAAWRTAEQDNVFATVFHYLFGHNHTGLEDMAESYFIAVPVGSGLGDPSSSFMTRFAAVNPTVRPASDCSTNGAITDRKRGSDGILFFIESIRWTDDQHAIVEGGYEEDVTTAARSVDLVEYTKGHWKVKKQLERDPNAPDPMKQPQSDTPKTDMP
jgi:hypothetical protein